MDFSAGMLAQARRKAADRGAANADFAEMDMQDLGFADGEFDAATCAFGIFFVEDMEGALAHVASKVRAGGKVAICSFRKDYFLPMRQLLLDRLAARGATLPPTAWERIASEAGSRKLLETAGLSEVRTEVRNAGYHLADENEWWDVVWNAGFRRLVGQLPAEDLPRFREEHLREVGAHKTGDGLWLDVGVVFSVGTVGAAGGA